MQAKYIQKIEINALWRGGRKVVWNLQPDVNILSGINGVGKSTIINYFIKNLPQMCPSMEGTVVEKHSPLLSGEWGRVVLSPADATCIRFDVIRSFDRPLLHGDVLEKLADHRVRTELDWQLYRLQKRYLDYQVNMGNRIIELLSSGDADAQERAAEVSAPKRMFQDMMDELFRDTRKVIDRKSNEIQFIQTMSTSEPYKETISPYQLSSGEKQMLVILLTVLVEDGQPYALLMDEPEVSLHIEWQQQLINLIRKLNPNAQIIMSTHSPALIMDGWMGNVTEVEEIVE